VAMAPAQLSAVDPPGRLVWSSGGEQRKEKTSRSRSQEAREDSRQNEKRWSISLSCGRQRNKKRQRLPITGIYGAETIWSDSETASEQRTRSHTKSWVDSSIVQLTRSRSRIFDAPSHSHVRHTIQPEMRGPCSSACMSWQMQTESGMFAFRHISIFRSCRSEREQRLHRMRSVRYGLHTIQVQRTADTFSS